MQSPNIHFLDFSKAEIYRVHLNYSSSKPLVKLIALYKRIVDYSNCLFN